MLYRVTDWLRRPKIFPPVLQKMRREFEYWYPFDLRVSGKDLIQVCTSGRVFNAHHSALQRDGPHLP